MYILHLTRVEIKEEILWNWINYDGYILNNVSECYFNRRAFRCFSKISLPCHITDIDLEKYEISKDLEISVKICGTIRLVSYRNPKFDREFEFSRRLLTVETGARASDIKRLAWSFDQALSFWRLLSRYERDSRSTLNGSAAKKLIIVPSTMWHDDHMPIRSAAFGLSFFEKHFHPLENQSRCNRRYLLRRGQRTCWTRGTYLFSLFSLPGRTSQLTRFTPPLRFVMLEMNLQPRQERPLNIWGEMHENSSHSCFLCGADIELWRTLFWRLLAGV